MHNGDGQTTYSGENAGWSAFLAGAFIGAGIALLFAPQTGQDLRGVLRKYASKTGDDLMDRGRDAWDTAVERGKDYFESGKEAVEEAGREAARTGREYMESGKETIKKTAKEAKETSFNRT